MAAGSVVDGRGVSEDGRSVGKDEWKGVCVLCEKVRKKDEAL